MVGGKERGLRNGRKIEKKQKKGSGNGCIDIRHPCHSISDQENIVKKGKDRKRIRGSERKNEKKRVGKGRKSSRYAVILPAKRQS